MTGVIIISFVLGFIALFYICKSITLQQDIENLYEIFYDICDGKIKVFRKSDEIYVDFVEEDKND